MSAKSGEWQGPNVPVGPLDGKDKSMFLTSFMCDISNSAPQIAYDRRKFYFLLATWIPR
jgi:hypothetical protein